MDTITPEELVKAVRAERERCAKIAVAKAEAIRSGDNQVTASGPYDPQSLPFIYASMAMTADDIAAAIRDKE